MPIPRGAGIPRDTGGDGKYDDVNGNGRKDFGDVVLHFTRMSWIAANEPVYAFDYNVNTRIDFADLVWLVTHLQSYSIFPKLRQNPGRVRVGRGLDPLHPAGRVIRRRCNRRRG